MKISCDKRVLPHSHAFLAYRSGEVVDSGFGSLTFQKPSAVSFEDNTADVGDGVSWGSVRYTTGFSVSRDFCYAVKARCCPLGIIDVRLLLSVLHACIIYLIRSCAIYLLYTSISV